MDSKKRPLCGAKHHWNICKRSESTKMQSQLGRLARTCLARTNLSWPCSDPGSTHLFLHAWSSAHPLPTAQTRRGHQDTARSQRAGLSPLSQGACRVTWECTLRSLLCTSAHQYFKSNRLQGSETDFNSSFHTLGKSFTTDFSFPKQVCVHLLLWG